MPETPAAGTRGLWTSRAGWHHVPSRDGEDPSVCVPDQAREPDADRAAPLTP